MTPKECADRFLALNEFCSDRNNQEPCSYAPDQMVLTKERQAEFACESAILAKAQGQFDANQWTEYSESLR